MLDPLTCLSLASNVVQLLDFSTKLVYQTHEFLKSSGTTLPVNLGLTELATRNKELSDEIKLFKRAQYPLTKCEATAQDAAQQCSNAAGLLLSELADLEVRPSSSKLKLSFNALGQGVRSRAKRRALEARQDTLRRLESHLATALLYLILQDQNSGFNDLRSLLQHRDVANGKELIAIKDEIGILVEKARQSHVESFKLVQGRLDDFAAQQKQSEERILSSVEKGSSATQQAVKTASKGLAEREEVERIRAEMRAKRLAILDSLEFPEMWRRRDTILNAHKKTFEWCFAPEVSKFRSWLEHGRGIFWVSGKAGSGKSTLVKLLTGHHRTREILGTWADRRYLAIAQHHFWYAGSDMQKSHKGLLQSLLSQILRSFETDEGKSDILGEVLFALLCKRRWEGQREMWSLPWTPEELMEAFRSILHCPEVCVCIFIDGLDEYQSQSAHIELIRDIQDLAQIPNLKLCVSSRPWNEFHNAFGEGENQLRLEDLTREDIYNYLRDKLLAAKSSSKLFEHQCGDQDLEDVILKIAEKAKGVFLWVRLIVSALCERIAAGKNIASLHRCIDDFPEELEEYFRRFVYDRIHKTWRGDTAQALKLAIMLAQNEERMYTSYKAHHPWGHFNPEYDRTAKTIPYSFQGSSFNFMKSFLPFWLLHEGLDEMTSATARLPLDVTQTQLHQMAMATQRHLNGCCRDLVFVHECHLTFGRCSCQIDFLHRTVYDFLLNSEEIGILLSKHTPKCFDDPSFLFKVCLPCFRIIPKANDAIHLEQLNDIALAMLPKSNLEYESNNPEFCVALKDFDKMGARYHAIFSKMRDPVTSIYLLVEFRSRWHHDGGLSHRPEPFLLNLLVANHFHEYVMQVARDDPGFFHSRECIVLLAALGLWEVKPFPLHEIDPQFIRQLLAIGANPGEKAAREPWNTVCVLFLRKVLQSNSTHSVATQHEVQQRIRDTFNGLTPQLRSIVSALLGGCKYLRVLLCLTDRGCDGYSNNPKHIHTTLQAVQQSCLEGRRRMEVSIYDSSRGSRDFK